MFLNENSQFVHEKMSRKWSKCWMVRLTKSIRRPYLKRFSLLYKLKEHNIFESYPFEKEDYNMQIKLLNTHSCYTALLWQFPCLPNLWLVLVILFRDIAVSLKEEFLFSIISEVSTLLSFWSRPSPSLISKELLRDIVEANLCKIFKYVYNDKLKTLDISEDTKPGAVEVKRGYLDELAVEQDTNATVLGGEELNGKEEALDSDEGELGGVEAADDHLGSPTIKRWSVQALL